MTKTSVAKVVNQAQSITPNFSMHERGITVDASTVSGSFIIDLDGNILEGSGGSDVNLVFIGGIDSHAHRKDSGIRFQYYLNDKQKDTLFAIGFTFGRLHGFSGKINEGNSLTLYNDLLGAFENGRG